MKIPESKQGFTLIELIIVIAILAFVTVVGIHNYGNVREIQAKKMNLANIKRVYHALATYETLCKEEGKGEFFKGFDALVDVSANGAWYGTPGEIDFGTWTSGSECDARQVNGGLGIYDGSWKALSAVYNAAGQGTGAAPGLAEAQEKNRGMRDTGLYRSLAVYYLSAADAELLRKAGVSTVYLHNPSTAQATGSSRGGYCTAVTTKNGVTLSADGLECNGGGPGFRPELSAFYQTHVTNGLPVAMIVPGSTIYRDFGYDLSLTNGITGVSEAKAAVAKTKLIAFGIGRNAECVVNQIGLGEAPVDPVFTKRDYRSYIAVFAIKTGGQGIASTCRLAGVLDAAGNTYKQAQYNADWQTELDN